MKVHHIAVAAVISLSCSADVPGNSGGVDSARAAPVVASAPAAAFTLDDFRRLHWLNGRWRGFMPDGKSFYEQYRLLNDSTLLMTGYRDSTFAAVADSARITLRRGTVSSENAASRYVASRLDSTGADFSPERGAKNAFTWARESADRWSATIRWTDNQGRPQSVVYALHRFGR